MKIEIKSNLPKSKYDKKWQFCIGSCHAATVLRTDACKLLKKMHEELGIRYVRFHGIFNDDMKTLSTFSDVMGIPGGDKFTERTFYKCGLVYDNVLECGLKPFVELSFMPELLALDKSHGKGFYGSIMSMPESLAVWADYMKAFIEFLLHRFGKEELEQWYFEVWNEPDLEGMFFKGTKEDYFRLYEVTAKAIKEACPSLKVGGPSTSGSKWIQSFVNHCEEHQLPLDFVSTHQYVGDPFLGISDAGGPDGKDSNSQPEEHNLENIMKQMQQLSTLFEQMPAETPLLQVLRTFTGDPTETTDMDRDVFKKNATIVRGQAKDYPLFYTEWNLCASFGAYSNDTRKTAAYDMRTALQINDLVDGSSIWCYSDIFEELHQFTEEFHGGFGLISLNGIPKPVFYGMKMLAEAEDHRIELDESCFTEVEAAAFEGSREKQILLFRQSMKQELKEKEKVTVTVEVNEKPQRIILQRIDEAHCNPLKEWEQMGSPKDLTKAEVQMLKEKTSMQDEVMEYQYQDGIITVQVDLAVNDIYFIRMVK